MTDPILVPAVALPVTDFTGEWESKLLSGTCMTVTRSTVEGARPWYWVRFTLPAPEGYPRDRQVETPEFFRSSDALAIYVTGWKFHRVETLRKPPLGPPPTRLD